MDLAPFSFCTRCRLVVDAVCGAVLVRSLVWMNLQDGPSHLFNL